MFQNVKFCEDLLQTPFLSKSGRSYNTVFLMYDYNCSICPCLGKPVCENSVYQISHITIKITYLPYNALAISIGSVTKSSSHHSRIIGKQ
jgi:hypothetical protein